MRHILTLARKDLRVLTRVKAGVFFTFVWPIIVAILFGTAFGGGGSEGPAGLRIAVVDQDGTPASSAFLDKLAASGDFQLDRVDLAAAVQMVRRGERAAYVVITPGFGEASQQVFYGPTRRIEVGIDPARTAEASMIEGLLTKHAMEDFQTLFSNPDKSQALVQNALKDLGTAGNTPETAPVARFLGELQTFLKTPAASASGTTDWKPVEITKTNVSRERLGPANAYDITFPQGSMWGIIGCVMSFAIALVSERVHGTYVRLQMAPISSAQVLAGKALACFITMALLQIVLIAIGVFAFGVSPSSYLLLALICACAALGFIGFMMMIAGIGRTEQAASGAGWAMLMPMTLFGGGMMPQFIMPGWMQTIGNASPVKWAIVGMEGAIWRNFSLAEMLLPCGILLTFGAVCFAIGVRGLRDN